ncbi:hypothetical protein CLV98_1386 [Dyadobacter jejuensis]|uniref:Uncharacterized protein n=1 Tax=Dyadobacter jejuensis TaxID=1082580 RepID=A0A316A119_9BACT|nr:hypothetical protein CLV98_1386 [Dyadobacter jejuensis]
MNDGCGKESYCNKIKNAGNFEGNCDQFEAFTKGSGRDLVATEYQPVGFL